MPNFEHGGAEGIMVEIASHFASHNMDVTFVVVKRKGPLLEKLNPKIKVINLNLKSQWFALLKLPFQIRKLKPDYIFSTMKESNFLAIFSKILALSNAKNIIREANTVSQQIKKEAKLHQRIKNIIIFHFYKYADSIVVLSKAMGDDLLSVASLDKSKLCVISNFVDFDKVNSLSNETINVKESLLFKEKNIFITVSRLFEQKNYFFLLDGLKKYKERNEDFTFISLGDGPLKNELENYTKNLNLENHCHFLGYRSNPFKYMKKSTVFLLPSLYEGMSNSLVQAMSLNCKVLVADSQPTSLEMIEKYKLGSSFIQNETSSFAKNLHSITNIESLPLDSSPSFGDGLQKYLKLIKR
jgi:glycosyltransferase involved in cell wall biosynthesis